jgi:REP element-mobilizing transposase RayT
VHVTWRVREEIWSLRTRRAFRQIARAFAAAYARGRGFRLIHFSVQGNHLHLVCEADDQLRLSRGLQSLAIRIARGINRVMQRRGSVFADRFHEHILRTVREVAHAVRYVLGNFAIHALRSGDRLPERYVDPFSSAAPPDTGPPLVHQPTTWLLSIGWKRTAA